MARNAYETIKREYTLPAAQKKAKKLPISAAPSDHDVINFERHHPKTWLVFAGIGSVRRAVS